MADKFIVIEWLEYINPEWKVIKESREGVDFKTVERIRNYTIEVRGKKPENVRIVRLGDDIAEVVHDQA